jgi:hypothetical protein
LPNQVLWSHRTGDGRKGLVAHLGTKLAASNATSGREATETTRMRLKRRETDWKQRRYGENYRRHVSQLDSGCKLSTSLTNILATWSVHAGDPILRS